MNECKYCLDEICVNDKCPMCADYCPVVDFPGVCRHEVRAKLMTNREGGCGMILLELLWGIIKWLFYYTTRPIIWIITGRDCRHCKYGMLKVKIMWYCNPFGWYCDRVYYPDKRACLETPWRCKFERR